MLGDLGSPMPLGFKRANGGRGYPNEVGRENQNPPQKGEPCVLFVEGHVMPGFGKDWEGRAVFWSMTKSGRRLEREREREQREQREQRILVLGFQSTLVCFLITVYTTWLVLSLKTADILQTVLVLVHLKSSKEASHALSSLLSPFLPTAPAAAMRHWPLVRFASLPGSLFGKCSATPSLSIDLISHGRSFPMTRHNSTYCWTNPETNPPADLICARGLPDPLLALVTHARQTKKNEAVVRRVPNTVMVQGSLFHILAWTSRWVFCFE